LRRRRLLLIVVWCKIIWNLETFTIKNTDFAMNNANMMPPSSHPPPPHVHQHPTMIGHPRAMLPPGAATGMFMGKAFYSN
jgi:hypothetical protein